MPTDAMYNYNTQSTSKIKIKKCLGCFFDELRFLILHAHFCSKTFSPVLLSTGRAPSELRAEPSKLKR